MITWSELQLRIYQTNYYHKKISFEDFLEVRRRVFNHAAIHLRQNPSQIGIIKTTATYYDKTLNCGIFNCPHEQALSWFQQAITSVCGENYRGWTKSEQVATTIVKIFVPPGFEDTSAEDYLEATRIMFEMEATRGIPWEVVKFYTHHTKHTHIIIASIPTQIYKLVKQRGTETNKGSGVWKTEGFLAPLKLTLANPNDLRSSRNKNTTTRPQPPSPQLSSPSHSSPSPSPPTSPKSPTPVPKPNDEPEPEPTIEAITNDLLLSSVAMSPMREDQDLENVNDVAGEVVIDGGEEEQGMDLSLLNPDPADTDDFCGNWADQMQ